MNIKVENYSEKAIAVFYASDATIRLNAAGALFNQFLTGGPGWIFSKKNADQAETLATELNLKVQDYSEKSVVIANTFDPIEQGLLANKGLLNPRLKGGPGWIFSKKRADDIRAFLPALIQQAA